MPVDGILAKMMVKDKIAADEKDVTAKLSAMSTKDIEAYMRSKQARDFLEMYPEGKAAGMILFPAAYSDGIVLAEPRQKEIQPFWDASPYRRRK